MSLAIILATSSREFLARSHAARYATAASRCTRLGLFRPRQAVRLGPAERFRIVRSAASNAQRYRCIRKSWM
jgi:hypothetical protein